MNAEPYRTPGSIIPANFDAPLFPKLRGDRTLIDNIVARTESVTAGQPFLTRLIYQYVRQYSAQIIRAEGPGIVDEIIQQKIVKNWQTNAAASHLNDIYQALLKFPHQDTLLILYMQILWQGMISVGDRSTMQAEQAALLRSKLVILKAGRLQVANSVYAAVFSMAWIEQQMPGLTRSVSIPELAGAQIGGSTAGNTPSKTSAPETLTPEASSHSASSHGAFTYSAFTYRTWSLIRLSILLGGLAIMGVAATGYFQGARIVDAIASPPPFASIFQPTDTADANRIEQQTSTDTVPEFTQPVPSHKERFDSGLEHATNGRWLPMLQEFCRIPQGSVYFAPAKRQMKRWLSLYPEAIHHAHRGLFVKENRTCSLLIEQL